MPTDETDDWGSWEQAEAWRRESFLARTPAQRLAWLKSALRLRLKYRALERKEAGTREPEQRDGDA